MLRFILGFIFQSIFLQSCFIPFVFLFHDFFLFLTFLVGVTSVELEVTSPMTAGSEYNIFCKTMGAYPTVKVASRSQMVMRFDFSIYSEKIINDEYFSLFTISNHRKT